MLLGRSWGGSWDTWGDLGRLTGHLGAIQGRSIREGHVIERLWEGTRRALGLPLPPVPALEELGTISLTPPFPHLNPTQLHST